MQNYEVYKMLDEHIQSMEKIKETYSNDEMKKRLMIKVDSGELALMYVGINCVLIGEKWLIRDVDFYFMKDGVLRMVPSSVLGRYFARNLKQ
jgi:hypothetical protein